MPRNVVVRLAMSLTSHEAIDGNRGDLAVLYRGHGEILAAEDTIAAGPHAAQRGAALIVDEDAVLLEVEDLRGVAEAIPENLLADGLEDHVGFEREDLAGRLRGFELDTAHAAGLDE